MTDARQVRPVAGPARRAGRLPASRPRARCERAAESGKGRKGNDMDKKRKAGRLLLVGNAVSAVCAVLVLGAVFVWAPPCQGLLELANGNLVPMRCVYTGKAAALLALLLLVACAASAVTKRPFTAVTVGLSVALALLAFETPATIGVCKSAGMACGATAAWLAACGGVSAVSALAVFFAGGQRKRVRP